MRLRYALLRPELVVLAGLLAAAPAALAQTPTVTRASLAPAANARTALRSTTVVVPFSQAIDPATAGNIKVFSPQYRGRRTATASTSGSTVTLTPTVPATGSQVADFKPGETVFVTVPATVKSTASVAAAKYVYQFTAATTGGTGTFYGTQDVGVGSTTYYVATGDVDGDGDLDLVAANNTSPGSVSVRLNTNGVFGGTLNVATDNGTTNVALGDADNDGDLDIFAANTSANTVSVRINAGNGTFSGGPDVSVGTVNSFSMTIGDVNGDGYLDILAADNTTTGRVNIRLNNGSGGFSGTQTASVAASPVNVVVGDVNNDGFLDLVTANFVAAGTASIRFGDGAGNFSGTQNVSMGPYTNSVTLGDVNNDGYLDIIAANYNNGGASTVSVRLNNGSGIFSGAQDVSVGNGCLYATLGDVDGDGDLDLVAANFGVGAGNTVSVRYNDGSGNFSGTTTASVGAGPCRIALGDLDGDGDLDMLTDNNGAASVSIRFNDMSPTALALSNSSLAENAGANATVGTFSTTDPDANQTFTYSLVSGTGSTDNGSFNISGSTLRLTASADYETKSSYAIRVRTTDQGGLFFEQTFIITIINQLDFTSTQTNVSCNGGSNGTASVTGLTEGVAPYTYSWNTTPVQTTATVTGLAAGLYTVTVADVNGLTGTRTYAITQPAALTTFVSLTSPTCGLANGMATVGASGGTGGYTYAWRNQTTNTALPQTTSSVSGLAAGTYQVTVTDANACTITRSFTLTSVADATAPVAVARNITVTIDATGTATVAPADVDNGSTDNCSIASRSLSRTSFTCADVSSGSTPVSAGNALAFDGTNDYVTLPGGAVNPATASGSGFTFEAWVNFAATPATWARIFDFGTGSATYLFLSPNNGSNGKLRFAIMKNSGGEQVIDATSAATLTGWHHYAVTLSKSGTTVTGLLYLDGVQVGSNAAMTLLPGDLGTLTQTWMGRSQFADPYPTATFEEVRLWDVARSASDIATSRNLPLTGTETGLRAYYDFNQTTGTTLPDVTGHGYAGTLQNFAGSGTASNWVASTAPVSSSGAPVSFGNALAFDGTNDYVSLVGAVLPTNATYTIEAWVYATAGTNRNILSSGTSPMHTFWLDGTNTLAGGHNTSYSAVAALNTFAFNTWTHVALTYNPTGGVMKLYQNGALLQTASGVSALTAATTANQLGAYAGGSTWSGQLDELRVWDTERTLAQIQATKDAPLTGTETGLRAYYNFDQTTGSTLPDATGHGYAGTLQNFALSGTTSNWVTSTVPVPPSAPSGVLVTLTVTDGAGNQATATARVTVQQPSVASTPTLTWTGAASTTWSDCGNWSYGSVPVASQSVSIPTGLSRYPVLPSGTTPLVGLAIASGASLSLATGATLQATGNVDNQGPALAGTVSLTGTTAQTLGGNFSTLVVNKASGTTTLSNNASIGTALTLTSGGLTTGTYALTLGSTATLTESATSYITGTVQATRAVSTAGSGESFGGLGLMLTPAAGSTALPGSTLVRRVTGTALTGQGTSTSIKRYYDIQPTTNAGLNMTVQLGYLDAELNGIGEGNLGMFRSSTGPSGPWQAVAVTSRDATANTVTATGVEHFSIWTLGSTAAPLPVELVAFTVTAEGLAAQLKWTTASEKNSARFEVERSADGSSFGKVGEVAAQGSKATASSYSFLDQPVLAGTHYYRLRQVDTDGTFSYSPVRVVTLGGGPATADAGLALFPNPAHNGAATFTGTLPGQLVQVFDALGRVVASATANAAGTATLALPTGLATGMYVVRTGNKALRLTLE